MNMLDSTTRNMAQESDPDKVTRQQEVQGWTPEKAKKNAQEHGLELTGDHMDVIDFLRQEYIENGWPRSAHELSQKLSDHFSDQGGLKHLHKLFPDAPVTQGSELAGLPKPPYSEDKGFGTAQ